MKKIFFLFAVLSISISSFAQLEILSQDSSTVITNDTLQLVPEQTLYFNVHNTGSGDLTYICLVTEVTMPDGAGFNLCSNGVCADISRPGQVGGEATLAADGYADPEPDVIYLNNGSTDSAFLAVEYKNINDTTDTAMIYFSYSLITALNNYQSNEKLSLAPNPANSNVMVDYSLEQKATLEVYDNNGRKIMSFPLQSKSDVFYLNTANLQDGIYFVKAGKVAKKLIIRH